MKKAILAGISEKENRTDFADMMAECQALCTAGEYQVEAVLTQNAVHKDVRTAFRKGKLEELRADIPLKGAEIVIFANDLTIQQAERISAYCDGIEVIDRTALILNIFSLHARTRQARLQVEMARLQYALPRMKESDERETHQRGGNVSNRGSGEMRSTILARQYHHRIKELHQQLDLLKKNHEQDERRRSKTMLARAALVGYTNAGKSSFMNAMLACSGSRSSSVLVKDQLFATLDTSVRMIETDKRQYLLYDTVGFVSHLPSPLLDAFHTTLDSARDADLLIQIVDASDERWLEKMDITTRTLKEIGAGDIPVLTVYNKIDLVPDRQRFQDGICVSAVSGEGMAEVREKIIQILYPPETVISCFIPYDRIAVMNSYRSAVTIEIKEQNEGGIKVRIIGPDKYVNAFAKYRI